MSETTRIGPHLWLGSWRPASDQQWLHANKIKTIINVAEDLNDPPCTFGRVSQIKFNLTDGEGNPGWLIKLAIDATVCALNQAADNNEQVLIHCVAGRSRSPYIAARAMEITSNGQHTFDEIYKAIRKLRPEVLEKSLLFGTY